VQAYQFSFIGKLLLILSNSICPFNESSLSSEVLAGLRSPGYIVHGGFELRDYDLVLSHHIDGLEDSQCFFVFLLNGLVFLQLIFDDQLELFGLLFE